ncbi:MAG: hypothetical protein EA381_02390 [Planctomycetaceae bacterium]|nr:MAG: hypothetical protein EA381_02390 [Planctomycetaceae bacterium]
MHLHVTWQIMVEALYLKGTTFHPAVDRSSERSRVRSELRELTWIPSCRHLFSPRDDLLAWIVVAGGKHPFGLSRVSAHHVER